MSDELVLITTGGTIAMRAQPDGGGAVPELGPDELRAFLPADILDRITWRVEAFCNMPSAHLTLDDLWKLRHMVGDWAGRAGVRGVVITHGTDTMEESAYLLDLTLLASCPIVLTGAMRYASEAGYDGAANLLDAVRVALCPDAQKQGAVIVMNGEIHAARYASKMHTLALDAFQSPGWGPIGRIEGTHVIFSHRVEREILPARRLEPDVHLIKLAAGMDESYLQHLIARSVRGIVIEAMGGGRVPPWWVPAIREAVEKDIAVVIASRCAAGRVYDTYGFPGAYRDLEAAGVIFANGLNGPKARLKLMVLLGAR
ncbi:MAG: asparaginase [Chloroflexi bacterium]|nr:asparaginase [Chloroflexota bacterium]